MSTTTQWSVVTIEAEKVGTFAAHRGLPAYSRQEAVAIMQAEVLVWALGEVLQSMDFDEEPAVEYMTYIDSMVDEFRLAATTLNGHSVGLNLPEFYYGWMDPKSGVPERVFMLVPQTGE